MNSDVKAINNDTARWNVVWHAMIFFYILASCLYMYSYKDWMGLMGDQLEKSLSAYWGMPICLQLNSDYSQYMTTVPGGI